MGEIHRKVTSIKLERNMGLLLLILSIILGPTSTIIAGVLAKGDYKTPGIVIGVLQWLTVCFFLFGYFWGIYTAWRIY
jgi:hypothetical protein